MPIQITQAVFILYLGLLGLDSRSLGNLGEPGDFSFDVVGELLLRSGIHIEPLCGERGHHI